MKTDYANRNHKSQRRMNSLRRITFRLIAFMFIDSIALSVNAIDRLYRSNAMQDFYPVDVTPHIEVKGEVITSRLVFNNRGQTPVLVMEGINGFGVRGSVTRDPQPLVNDEFTISINGRKIQYVGPFYKRTSYTKEYFSPLQPCEVIDVRYNRLDLAYEFVRGTHEYIIVHHHFEYDEKTGKVFQVNSRPVKFLYTRR